MALAFQAAAVVGQQKQESSQTLIPAKSPEHEILMGAAKLAILGGKKGQVTVLGGSEFRGKEAVHDLYSRTFGNLVVEVQTQKGRSTPESIEVWDKAEREKDRWGSNQYPSFSAVPGGLEIIISRSSQSALYAVADAGFTKEEFKVIHDRAMRQDAQRAMEMLPKLSGALQK